MLCYPVVMKWLNPFNNYLILTIIRISIRHESGLLGKNLESRNGNQESEVSHKHIHMGVWKGGGDLFLLNKPEGLCILG